MKMLEPVLLAATGFLFVICAQSAEDLPRATALLTCNVDGEGEHSVVVSETVFSRADSITFNAACDVNTVRSNPDGPVYETRENADGYAISGPEPQADARAATQAKVYPWGDASGCTTYANADVDVQVDLEFAVSVREKVQPRFRPAAIPTRVLLLASMQASVTPPETGFIDVPGAVAIVQFKTKGGIVLHQNHISVQGAGSESLEYEISVRRDLLYNEQGNGEYAVMEFAKQAYAGAYSDVQAPCARSDVTSSSAQAVLDPIVELDQERFDELYGQDSFPLADYYEIVASPNLFDLLYESGFEDYENP